VRQRLVYLLARLLRVSTPMVWITPDNVAPQLKVVEAKWQEALRIAVARAFLEGHAQGQRELVEELQAAGPPLTTDELEVLGRRQLH